MDIHVLHVKMIIFYTFRLVCWNVLQEHTKIRKQDFVILVIVLVELVLDLLSINVIAVLMGTLFSTTNVWKIVCREHSMLMEAVYFVI